ncbi:hypothetical protein ATCC90586_008284 [Pythium insidiosum]|nr:hypothetical protein ATCC90586_008284 [Pythium insidiosum]
MLRRLVKEATGGFSSASDQPTSRKRGNESRTRRRPASDAVASSEDEAKRETTTSDQEEQRRQRRAAKMRDEKRRERAGRIKREPLLELHVIEAVHGVMHDVKTKKKYKAARHELLRRFKQHDPDDTGLVDDTVFKKCISKAGIKLKKTSDVEALVSCFRRELSRNDDDSESTADDRQKKAKKSTRKAEARRGVDYVAFMEFASNVRDSEKLSAIADKLRDAINKYDDKHDRTTTTPFDIYEELHQLDKRNRGWIASEKFSNFLDEHEQPTLHLKSQEVGVLVERFEYEFEKGELGVDYKQFAQWLQPMLHMDVSALHKRVKELVIAAQERGGWRLDEVFEAMDEDGDGHVSGDELKGTLFDIGLPLTDAQVRCLVDEYDTNGDGKIQYEDVQVGYPSPSTIVKVTSSNVTNAFRKPSPPEVGVKSALVESYPQDVQAFVRKMPPMIIAPFVALPVLAEYMMLMQDWLASKSSGVAPTVCDPVLTLLPQIVDDHDAISIFRHEFDACVTPAKTREDRQSRFRELVLRMWPSFTQLLGRIPSTLLEDASAGTSRRLSLLLPTAGTSSAPAPAQGTTNKTPVAHQERLALLQRTAQGPQLVMTFLRAQADEFAVAQGFPLAGFRLILALVACSVVAPVLHIIKSEHARHAFIVAMGIYTGFWVFDWAVLHSIGSAAAVYGLMLVAPRKIVGKLVLALMLAYLVGCHYYREFKSPDIVWDAAQMILTLKLSSIAINYSDGALPKEKMTPTMLKNHLQAIPPVLPYLSYAFFFPTFLAGPAFEYPDYIRWIKEVRVAPFMVHLRNLFVIIISAIGFVLSMEYPVDVIDSPDFYPDASWAERCLRMCVRVMLFRFKFYIAWSLAEAASALAGVGYVAETGKWNGITNNDILCVEVPTNIRVGINNWNMGVAKWINTYIYQRVGLSKSGKSGLLSTMSAFFVSALWHGLSPGYYLFFILGGVYIEAGKQLRRRVRPFFHYTEDRGMYPHAIFLSYFKGQSHPLAFVYDISGTLITWVAMQYAGVAFEILDVRRCLRIWASWYFLPHIIAVAVLVLSKTIPQRRPAPKDNKSVDKKTQ